MEFKYIKEKNNHKISEENQYKNFDKNMINEINKLTKKSSSSRSRVTCRDWKEESNKDNYYDGNWPIAILGF